MPFPLIKGYIFLLLCLLTSDWVADIVNSTLGVGHFYILINILKLCSGMQLSFLQIDGSFHVVFIPLLYVNIPMVSPEKLSPKITLSTWLNGPRIMRFLSLLVRMGNFLTLCKHQLLFPLILLDGSLPNLRWFSYISVQVSIQLNIWKGLSADLQSSFCVVLSFLVLLHSLVWLVSLDCQIHHFNSVCQVPLELTLPSLHLENFLKEVS